MTKLEFKTNAKRLADDDIYLGEERHEKPKEVFKLIASKIEERGISGNFKLLDVGCSTGEFIYFLKHKFKEAGFTGIDVSEKMIDKAKEKIPGGVFLCKDILTNPFISEEKYDVVVCIGVLQIFDDLETPIKSLLSCLKENGVLYVLGPFNENPVDTLVRYRTLTPNHSQWQLGWNLYSKNTYENILNQFGVIFKWSDFKMPFSIQKTSDPMRTWTIETKDNHYQLVNGNSQMINIKLLEINLNL